MAWSLARLWKEMFMRYDGISKQNAPAQGSEGYLAAAGWRNKSKEG
jgi:hypothetical protein